MTSSKSEFGTPEEFGAALADTRQRSAHVIETCGRAIDSIRRNGDLNAQAKGRKITEVWSRAAGEVSRLWDREEAVIDGWKRLAEVSVLGSPSSLDPAAVASNRAAREIARGVDRSEALDRYADAVLQNDRDLSRAIGALAVKNGWGEVVDVFSNGTPGMSEEIAALRDLTEAKANPFMRTVHYVLARPAEVESTASAA